MSRVSSPCCCIKIGGYGPKNDYTSLGTKMEGVNIMFKSADSPLMRIFDHESKKNGEAR